jgi:diacylglycerol kinase family enzyme
VTSTQSRPPGGQTLLPYGAPYLIGDAASARRDLTELRRELARAGVVAEAAVARPAAGALQIAQRALERGARLLVAVGDDRIAHALVSALIGQDGPRHPDAVLGLVGLGRQNLAATFGLPDDIERAARHLLGGGVFVADAGRARWHGPGGTERVGVFGNCVELGYPAEVSSRVPRAAWARRLGGFAAALRGLAATRSTPARLALERGAVDFRLAGLVVANGQFTMHRMKVSPRALPDDGRMSVIAFEGRPLTIYSRSKQLYYGDHIPHPTIREYQSKIVEVDTAEPMAIALDGCRVPGGPPLTVEVLTNALRVKV